MYVLFLLWNQSISVAAESKSWISVHIIRSVSFLILLFVLIANSSFYFGWQGTGIIKFYILWWYTIIVYLQVTLVLFCFSLFSRILQNTHYYNIVNLSYAVCDVQCAVTIPRYQVCWTGVLLCCFTRFIMFTELIGSSIILHHDACTYHVRVHSIIFWNIYFSISFCTAHRSRIKTRTGNNLICELANARP